MIINELNSVLAEVNKVYSATGGGFTHFTNPDDIECCGFIESAQGDDIVIHYDYCADDLSEADEDKLREWLYGSTTGWGQIYSVLKKHGYRMIEDNDGSGDGLYYGAELFRKV